MALAVVLFAEVEGLERAFKSTPDLKRPEREAGSGWLRARLLIVLALLLAEEDEADAEAEVLVARA